MVSSETTRRLRWHAGLEANDDDAEASVSACTAPGSSSQESLGRAVADFIAALSQLNHELNGDVPSESGRETESVSIDIAYAVAEVARFLRERGDQSGDAAAREAAWLVDTAWLAVLAGDIDNLDEHLKDVEAAR